jgi:hypothetical protein
VRRSIARRQSPCTPQTEDKELTVGQVSASSSIVVAADPQRTLAAIADYETVRPRILSPHYHDYKVVEGGKGAGTVAEWRLQATQKRSRNVHAVVSVSDSMVTERDSNSSMVTTWTVTPSGTGSLVTIRTSWKGAGGVSGFFEGIFAPLGLKKIQAEVLEKLKGELA